MADISSALIATNLLTAPNPTVATWPISGGITATDSANGIVLTCTNPGDNYVRISVPVHPNTAYVLTAKLTRLDSPSLPNGPFFAYEMNAGNIVKTYVNIRGNGFALTTSSNTDLLGIRLYAANGAVGDVAVWSHIGLYTAADWQAMQALNPPVVWFSGDAMATA